MQGAFPYTMYFYFYIHDYIFIGPSKMMFIQVEKTTENTSSMVFHAVAHEYSTRLFTIYFIGPQ